MIGRVLLGLATGSLMYVVTSDLLPVVHRTGGRWSPVMVGTGVLLVYGVLILAQSAGIER
jgi:zinc transporter ZupT